MNENDSSWTRTHDIIFVLERTLLPIQRSWARVLLGSFSLSKIISIDFQNTASSPVNFYSSNGIFGAGNVLVMRNLAKFAPYTTEVPIAKSILFHDTQHKLVIGKNHLVMFSCTLLYHSFAYCLVRQFRDYIFLSKKNRNM